MKRRISTFFAIAAFAMAAVLGSTEGLAQYAWITDEGHNQVVGIGVQLLNRIEFSGRLRAPWGVAVTADGSRVYVTQYSLGSVAVIATVDNSLITTIPLKNGASNYPFGVAVNPKDGSASGSINRVYVTNSRSGTVSVIDTMIG
jgi:DNA-binding beta-propeller fold protein YncE